MLPSQSNFKLWNLQDFNFQPTMRVATALTICVTLHWVHCSPLLDGHQGDDGSATAIPNIWHMNESSTGSLDSSRPLIVHRLRRDLSATASLKTGWLEYFPVIGSKTTLIWLATSIAYQHRDAFVSYLTWQLPPLHDIVYDFDELCSLGQNLLVNQASKGFDKSELDKVLSKCGWDISRSVSSIYVSEIKRIEGTKQKQCAGTAGKPPPARPKRGDHVINNGVLSIYRDIIDMFCRRIGRQFGDMPRLAQEPATMWTDYHNPIPDSRVVNDIQNIMVAWFPEGTAYVDANSVAYGTMVYALRNTAVTHMELVHNNRFNRIQRFGNGVGRLANQMNVDLVYVDHFALQQWLGNGGDTARYNNAKRAVRVMLEGLKNKLTAWVHNMNVHGYGRWAGFDELRRK